MKLTELLQPLYELDLRPSASSKYPTKKFNYDEWKRMSAKYGGKPGDKKDSSEDKKLNAKQAD